MTDQELADKIVALIGCPPEMTSVWSDDSFHEFVRDWRVAGAMIEKVTMSEQILVGWNMNRQGNFWCDIPTISAEENIDRRDESLPRAINEACAEALSTVGEVQEHE